MSQSLLISVRFHEGRYHGQQDGFSEALGWPPSPARLFQALVAGAACGAKLDPRDLQAFRWMENLHAPTIASPRIRRGRSVKLFVPNNDLDTVGGDPAQVAKIRAAKHWRPSFFDPRVPLHYLYSFEAGADEAGQICKIAKKLYQLGRTFDIAWAEGQVLSTDSALRLLEQYQGVVRTPRGEGTTPVPHTGTLDSVMLRYSRKRERLQTVVEGRKARQLFSQPPKASFGRVGYDSPPRRLHFELRTASGDFAPRPLAFSAPLIDGLKKSATRRLQDALPEQSALFERMILGRDAGPADLTMRARASRPDIPTNSWRDAGPADLTMRARVIPVPSIGTTHTDPSIRRIVVEAPNECPIQLGDLRWALAGVQPFSPSTGEVWPGALVSTADSRMADRFTRPSKVFRSITPLALPEAPRRRIHASESKKGAERGNEDQHATHALLQALRHAGIRTPPTDVRFQREPFHRRGVPAEEFAAGTRFSKHALWHVEIRFPEPVGGPLVVGNGRYTGLGLLEPVEERREGIAVFNLSIPRPLDQKARQTLLLHLRRALMAVARYETGQVGQLFSGHDLDGRPARTGTHEHVFLSSDVLDDMPGLVRLIVAAPWVCDRSTPAIARKRLEFEKVVHKFTDLRAGSLGRFESLQGAFLQDGDPVIGPALAWISRTPYVSTRHLKKREDPSTSIEANFVGECARRGLPRPKSVQVSSVTVGPHGGRPAAMLKAHFSVAVRGPLMLGRASHLGGGLFHASSSPSH